VANCTFQLVGSALFIVLSSGLLASALANDFDAVRDRDTNLWQPNTMVCLNELPPPSASAAVQKCPDDKICFPTAVVKRTDGLSECEDGDMTLFNALLCYSRIEEGCAAVQLAQNTITGQWYRSPRLRQFPRLHSVNSFSPDQALGVMLWVAHAPSPDNLQRFRWWLDWIGRNQRCVSEGCATRAARFCPDDDIDGSQEAVLGCTLKPIDFALLGQIVNHFKITVSDSNLRAALSRAAPNALALVVANAQFNRPGFPQHLAAVSLLLLKTMGFKDPALGAAVKLIADSQPLNPFFAWLQYGPTQQVAQLVLQECPASQDQVPPETNRFQWAWQRQDDEQAWKQTMLWDCRFIASLLSRG
jgi:hypothetical protein